MNATLCHSSDGGCFNPYSDVEYAAPMAGDLGYTSNDVLPL